MYRKVRRSLSLGLIIAFMFCTFVNIDQAQAAYSVGFKNQQIQITSPQNSGITCSNEIQVEGTSSLDTVWFCVRGPKQEVSTWKADVDETDHFSANINLRFGSGKYTIWAGDNQSRFDGKIRFIVDNQTANDTRYTSASGFVDYNDPAILDLATAIAPSNLNDQQKVENIHNWVASNIVYDYNAYLQHDVNMIPASQTLKTRKGLCRDFSFLFAALCRASGLPAKVVYGEARSGSSWELHAWNEVLVNNQWISVDSSWDSGYVSNNRFVQSLSNEFLAPDSKTFSLTHRVTQTTVH